MEARKILVKEGDIVIIACPLCRKTKKLSVVHYKENGKRDLRIKCSCDNKFCLCLEYRKHPRKSINLDGRSINHIKRESRHITVENISMGGIGFIPDRKHRTQKDDQLQVSFALNDINHTPIDAQVVVRTIYHDYVGCEFKNTLNFRTSLGFYLLS